MSSSILEGKKVLIVDDYEINTQVISLAVEDTGAVPLTASNGQESIDIVKNQKVDIILMDRHMPVMDGLEATRIIRTLPEGKDVAIIGISGSDEGSDSRACIDAGMDLICDKLEINSKKLILMAEHLFGKTTENNDTSVKENTDSDKTPKVNELSCASINYEKALSEFDGDRELLDSLIVQFCNIVSVQVNAMEYALEKKDYSYIQNEAHGIKGGAANLCAVPLADAAKSLEAACKEMCAPEKISELFEKIKFESDAFKLYVKHNFCRT